MDDQLLPWLRTQIAASARNAQAAKVRLDAWAPDLPPWESARYLRKFGSSFDEFVALQTPDAVLAQCEAHTRILDEVVPAIDQANDQLEHEFGTPDRQGPRDDSDLLIKLIASCYQHNPGYQEAWRP